MTRTNLQPVIKGTHSGESNFIVSLIGYGRLRGDDTLFNEIGAFSGETLLRDMRKGAYLLAVRANGAWTIRFRR